MGATNKLASGFVNELRRIFKGFRLSRSENQQRVGMLALHDAESNQCERLFCGHDAARDNDRRATLPASFRLEPGRKRPCRGNLLAGFEVSADRDTLRGGAQWTYAFSVLLCL